MASADMTLITEATIKSVLDGISSYGGLPNRVAVLEESKVYVDHSVGTRVFGWDKVNAKPYLIKGDTGWRDVKADITLGTAATNFWIRRTNDEIHVSIQGLTSDVGGDLTFYSLVSGFKADSQSIRAGVIATLDTNAVRVVSPFTSSLRVLGFPKNTRFEGRITFTTNDPWPTALPGVAV